VTKEEDHGEQRCGDGEESVAASRGHWWSGRDAAGIVSVSVYVYVDVDVHVHVHVHSCGDGVA
jgi:hypothetical protein